MNSRRRLTAAVAMMAVLLAVVGVGIALAPVKPPPQCVQTGRPPAIHPDYSGRKIPCNIAPLNFAVAEPGVQYRVRVQGLDGSGFVIASRNGAVDMPLAKWRRLLSANRGREIEFHVFVQGQDGSWRRFQPISNTVSPDPIDSFVVYRLMKPFYTQWLQMRIVQRDLSSFDQRCLVNSIATANGVCVNCHSFAERQPQTLSLQIRAPESSSAGMAMLLAKDGRVRKLDSRTRQLPMPAGVTAWHPNGRLAAFSANKFRQFFHTRGDVREVLDYVSDVAILDTQTNEVFRCGALCREEQLETYPAWSPDGRQLYFCSAPIRWPTDKEVLPESVRAIRYSLMRIGYDAATNQWGDVETILSAQETNKSITEPRISPDGALALVCMSHHGVFPTSHRDSDLYVIDLASRRYWPLAEANGNRSESWHSWSSNGRWILFASRRECYGLFVRLFVAHVDETGHASKSFVMPQKDPAYYGRTILDYNLPELIQSPIPLSTRAIWRAIHSEADKSDPGIEPKRDNGQTPWTAH